MAKKSSSDELKEAFDRLEGCIEYKGNALDLLKAVRKNELDRWRMLNFNIQ